MWLHRSLAFLVLVASALLLTEAQSEAEHDGPWSWLGAEKGSKELPVPVAEVPAGGAPARPLFGAKGMGLPTFSSVTATALKAECAKLKEPQANGEVIMMNPKVKAKLEKICAGLAKMPTKPKAFHDWLKAAPATNFHFSKGDAGKHVALGCTSLLKAKSNGKLEWFEKQPWYKKSLKMCTTLSGKSQQEIEMTMMKHRKSLSHMAGFRQQSAVELMTGTCQKLFSIAKNHEVRSHPFYSQAQQMCSTIGLKSPQELKSMLQRSETRAETASGQLMKQTCGTLEAATMKKEWKRFQSEPWYSSAVAMCQKLGQRKVGVKRLAARCAWLANAEKTGKNAHVKDLPWYNRLASACKWIAHLKEHSEKEVGNEGTGKEPVLV